jgi:integrase
MFHRLSPICNLENSFPPPWINVGYDYISPRLVKVFEFGQQCPPGLSLLWPTVPNWKRSASPDVLCVRERRALVNSIDVTQMVGTRDVAMLRLMMDRGLRCSEVTQLNLDDVHWRDGTIEIR